MSSENDNLFEQDLPLYNEQTLDPKPVNSGLKIKSSAEQISSDEPYEPIASGLTIKSRPADNDDTPVSQKSGNGLKIKSSTNPGLSIKRAAPPEPQDNPQIIELEVEKPKNLELNELPEDKPSVLQIKQPHLDTSANSMDGELFSSSRVNSVKTPTNSDSIKNLEDNDPVPEPGAHSPQTIILRNRPLPESDSTIQDNDGPELPPEPPPIIKELEEYEQVLNTAAQESVFELKQEEEYSVEKDSVQEELFEEIHQEEPVQKKNSPTIYEMEDDSSIGSMLMSARQKASLTIKELSRRTNIREACIIALEEENRSTLPDPIYTKSYIKNLCNELNLDYPRALKLYSDLCGEEFDTQYNIAQKGPDKYASKPANSAMQKWSALAMACIIFGLIATGFVAKYFYTPLPVFKAGEQVNLNDFHQPITVPIPRLNVPNK